MVRHWPRKPATTRKRDSGQAQEGDYRHPFPLVYEFQELLEAGVVNNRAGIASQYGLSRTRVTQVMNLLHLPDEIQEYVIALPPREQRLYCGRRLREILDIGNEEAQGEAFEELVTRLSETARA